MKFRFEGSETEFRALFGVRGAPVVTPALMPEAAAAKISEKPEAGSRKPEDRIQEQKIMKYKINDIVQLIDPDQVEGKEYADFYKRYESGGRITAVSDDGYTVNDEMILNDEYIVRLLAHDKGAKSRKTDKVTQASSLQDLHTQDACGTLKTAKTKRAGKGPGSGRQKAPAITPADIKAKVDFSKYTTIPELLTAIVDAGFCLAQIHRLLGLEQNGDVGKAARGDVYPYVARAIAQHLQFPPPVPATERELHGLDNKTLAKAREIGS